MGWRINIGWASGLGRRIFNLSIILSGCLITRLVVVLLEIIYIDK